MFAHKSFPTLDSYLRTGEDTRNPYDVHTQIDVTFRAVGTLPLRGPERQLHRVGSLFLFPTSAAATRRGRRRPLIARASPAAFEGIFAASEDSRVCPA